MGKDLVVGVAKPGSTAELQKVNPKTVNGLLESGFVLLQRMSSEVEFRCISLRGFCGIELQLQFCNLQFFIIKNQATVTVKTNAGGR